MALVEDVYEELNEAVESGSFALRLAYWAAYFEANENLSSLDDTVTSSMLVADESYFSDSNTKPPSPKPTLSTQPLVTDDVASPIDDTSGSAGSADDGGATGDDMSGATGDDTSETDGGAVDDISGGDDTSETTDATDDKSDDLSDGNADAVSPPTEQTGDAFAPTPMPASSPADTGTISISSSKKNSDDTDAASTASIVVPLIAFFILCVMAGVYMYQQKKGCFAEIDQVTSNSSVLDSGNDIAVEADTVQSQSTLVDEADMSAAIVSSKNESSLVEAPASLVTDVQEKIIEADL
jgi:hypothetical protein